MRGQESIAGALIGPWAGWDGCCCSASLSAVKSRARGPRLQAPGARLQIRRDPFALLQRDSTEREPDRP